ncbi:MAG: hypothetical protein JW953_04545 [Anaerolineae bacterium]|nr:hypothetical protein [Anaerolineae bacterium]
MRSLAISPHYNNTDFPSGLTLDDKIEVFADRVRGWQLEVAQEVSDKLGYSGFAVLHIVMSYFEMIAKFREGFTERGKSRHFFREGIYWVFPELQDHLSELSDTVLDQLYEEVRCALYHGGITAHTVMLTGDIETALAFSEDGSLVVINPHRLVPALSAHFEAYVHDLGNPKKDELRRKFEARFNWNGK